EAYQQSFQDWKNSLLSLQKSQSQLSEHIQQEDYIRFQLKEIEEISPSIEEENDLLRKKNASLNMEKNQKVLQRSQQRLSGDEDASILMQLSRMIKDLDGSELITSEIFE